MYLDQGEEMKTARGANNYLSLASQMVFQVRRPQGTRFFFFFCNAANARGRVLAGVLSSCTGSSGTLAASPGSGCVTLVGHDLLPAVQVIVKLSTSMLRASGAALYFMQCKTAGCSNLSVVSVSAPRAASTMGS